MEGRPLDDTNSDSATAIESDSDSALVERARRGDIAAYEEIVRRYQKLAFRIAYTIVGSAADAEDAAQEGFVRAYHALHRFHQGAPLRPWLVTIVANAARGRRTAAGRHPTLTLSAAEFLPDDSTRSPETAALVSERRKELLAAVDALRDDDRQVIAYRYFFDLSEAETAELLGCARGTVKSRLSRALDRLRQGFGGDGQTAAAGGRHG